MRIGVPLETAPRERRVALVPESAGRLAQAGLEVVVQREAGASAGFADEAYRKAGARISDTAADALGAEMVLKVRRPSLDEARLMAPGAALAAFLQPAASRDLLALLAERSVTGLALELVPRITRAQSMDALSSQATVAGYEAVLLGATHLWKLMPMLTTAAGTLAPAKAFVVGAGVAGLQAIATARRLGAVVSGFDVRWAVREQVMSLGASFLEVPVFAEGAGGYAKELGAEEQAQVRAAVARHVKDQDLVITTAQVPGRPAPRILDEEMVRSMRPGSVIVDLAAEGGGNCAFTRPGETVELDGVTLLGPLDLAASAPLHASQMYSRNLEALVKHLWRDGALRIDLDDEIIRSMAATHRGEVRQGMP